MNQQLEQKASVLSVLVPLEHGVDGLGELDQIRLVDAARVGPDVPNAGGGGLGAETSELWRPKLPGSAPRLHVLERRLARPPRVGQNRILGDSIAVELFQLPRRYVDEPHCHFGDWILAALRAARKSVQPQPGPQVQLSWTAEGCGAFQIRVGPLSRVNRLDKREYKIWDLKQRNIS